MRNGDRSDGGNIAQRLSTFGTLVAGESPLYGRVCTELADDPAISAILAAAPYEQPAANVLLAAVQYLLLGGAEDALALHYPSVTGGGTAPADDPVALFAAFCVAHRDELTELVSTRSVQTNEVRRCVGLLPAFAHIAALSGGHLAILELGCSVGLNLMFDRYHYDFGEGRTTGPVDSPVRLATSLRRGSLPSVVPLPEVTWRCGIDLHPIDVLDSDEVRWARSFLWPEQLERIGLFEAAVRAARPDPPRLVAGDIVDSLVGAATAAPEEATLVVFHSFVLNQLPPTSRDLLTAEMEAVADDRPLHRIGIEMMSPDRTPPPIVHTVYDRGQRIETVLGTMHHHGGWLEWDR